MKRVLKRAIRQCGRLGRHADVAYRGARESIVSRFYSVGKAAPWTSGYMAYRRRFLREVLGDCRTMDVFSRAEPLPAGYGVGIDERCVEYPWLLSRLPQEPSTIMDAGSVLNDELILDQAPLQGHSIHIVTLAPEPYQRVSRHQRKEAAKKAPEKAQLKASSARCKSFIGGGQWNRERSY